MGPFWNPQGQSIENRFIEEMDRLGIDDSNQIYILETDINPFIKYGKHKQALHSMRVPILGLKIAEFLGVGANELTDFWFALAAHDRGKLHPECLPAVDTTEYTAENCKRIRFHVDASVIATEYGSENASAIEQHHIHQRVSGPYPCELKFPRSPEGDFKGRIFAVADCTDSAIWRCNGATPESALQRVMQDYGDLDLIYRGNRFPKLELKGKEILDYLASINVFRRE